MTNQSEKKKKKNRNHRNTGVSFEFNYYLANLLEWGGLKWVTFAPFLK